MLVRWTVLEIDGVSATVEFALPNEKTPSLQMLIVGDKDNLDWWEEGETEDVPAILMHQLGFGNENDCFLQLLPGDDGQELELNPDKSVCYDYTRQARELAKDIYKDLGAYP